MTIETIVDRLQRQGVVRGLQHMAQGLAFRLLEMRPSRRRARAQSHRKHLEFDRRFDIDTCGILHLEDAPRSRRLIYGPVEEHEFKRAIDLLPPRLDEFTMVDVGAGKGKAVILAAQRGFGRVVGVEISRDLVACAERNLERVRQTHAWAHKIDLVCDDATEFALADRPTVLFLFNPFGADVMAALVQNVGRWMQRTSHDMFVVYIRPHQAHVWERSGLVETFHRDPGLAIYRRG